MQVPLSFLSGSRPAVGLPLRPTSLGRPTSGSGLSESLVAGLSRIFKVLLEFFCAGILKVTKVVLKWLVSPTRPLLLAYENTRLPSPQIRQDSFVSHVDIIF